MSDIQKITGLWQKSDKNGNMMLSCSINQETLDILLAAKPNKILILHNYKRESDRHPTHYLCAVSSDNEQGGF